MILGFPYDQKIDLWLGELGSNESNVELTHDDDELTSRFDVSFVCFVTWRVVVSNGGIYMSVTANQRGL